MDKGTVEPMLKKVQEAIDTLMVFEIMLRMLALGNNGESVIQQKLEEMEGEKKK